MNVSEKQGCLEVILQVLGLKPTSTEREVLPYRIRDDFLSPAELNFYRVLQSAIGDWAAICPKVSLGDLFYAKSREYRTNVAYRNKIVRKHVDFLLCDPQSMRPLLGIELDDASHRRATRQERDRFVEQVFAAAGLPLQRVPVRFSYNTRELAATLKQRAGVNGAQVAPQTGLEACSQIEAASPAVDIAKKPGTATLWPPPSGDAPPLCPKCGQPMVLRVTKKKGPYQNRRFWGCRDFPRCRGIREYEPKDEHSGRMQR